MVLRHISREFSHHHRQVYPNWKLAQRASRDVANCLCSPARGAGPRGSRLSREPQSLSSPHRQARVRTTSSDLGRTRHFIAAHVVTSSFITTARPRPRLRPPPPRSGSSPEDSTSISSTSSIHVDIFAVNFAKSRRGFYISLRSWIDGITIRTARTVIFVPVDIVDHTPRLSQDS